MMGTIFDGILRPPPPAVLDESRPVIAVWKEDGARHERAFSDLPSARLAAIKIIGIDDRMVVGIFDRKTKEMAGKVGLYAGYPYWKRNGKVHSINRDGSLARDLFDFRDKYAQIMG